MYDTTRGLAVDEDPTFEQVSIGANFDVILGRRSRVFLGPRLVLLRQDGVDAYIENDGMVRQTGSTDPSLGLGLLAGADLQLRSGRWALHGTLRYVEVLGRNDGRLDLQIDPVMLTIGVARRF